MCKRFPEYEESLKKIERSRITLKDIENFFPYLKNLEDQVVDPEDFCEFQTEMNKTGKEAE